MDVAGAEVRVGAGDQRVLLDDVVALVEDEAEDAAVGAGETVPAPVAAEEIALIFLREIGGVVAHELGVGAAVHLLARRGERMLAGEPFVVDAGPAVAMIIDAFDDADEAIGIAFAVGEEPKLAERIVLEGIGDAQAVDETLHLGAVGVHAHDHAGAAAAGDFAVGAVNVDGVIADATCRVCRRGPIRGRTCRRGSRPCSCRMRIFLLC